MAQLLKTRLRFRNDQSNNRTRDITSNETIIGSHEGSDIWIKNSNYPSTIASIHLKTGRYWLQNKAFPFAVFINETLVDQIAELHSDDKITFGKIEVIFEIVEDSQQNQREQNEGETSDYYSMGGTVLELKAGDQGLNLQTEIYENIDLNAVKKNPENAADEGSLEQGKGNSGKIDLKSLTPNQVYMPEDHSGEMLKDKIKSILQFAMRYSKFLGICFFILFVALLNLDYIIALLTGAGYNVDTSKAIGFFREISLNLGLRKKTSKDLKNSNNPPPLAGAKSENDCPPLQGVIPADSVFKDPTGFTFSPAQSRSQLENNKKKELDSLSEELFQFWVSRPNHPMLLKLKGRFGAEGECKEDPQAESCIRFLAQKGSLWLDYEGEISRTPAHFSKPLTPKQELDGPGESQENEALRKEFYNSLKVDIKHSFAKHRASQLREKILPTIVSLMKEVLQQHLGDSAETHYYLQKLDSLIIISPQCSNDLDSTGTPVPFLIKYERDKHELKVCESGVYQEWSELNLAYHVTRQLGFILDPCNIPKPDSKSPIDNISYQKLLSNFPLEPVLDCLEKSGVAPQTQTSDCKFSLQARKKFHAWLVTEILSKYPTLILNAEKPEEFRGMVANMIREFPHTDVAVEQSFLSDPVFRIKMGCPPQSHEIAQTYCTMHIQQ